MDKIKKWLRKERPPTKLQFLSDYDLFRGEVIPCSQISVHTKWSKSFSKMISESTVRTCRANDDAVEDIIIGYGLDDNFQYNDEAMAKCPIGKNGEKVSCQGGLIALDGQSGNTLWQRWTLFNVFSLYCAQDINNDGHEDCIAAGRSGVRRFTNFY